MNTFVEMAGYTWETGRDIVDVQTVLGSADKSSSCKVILSDPMHIIASALINHSIKSGGILALPDTNKAPSISLPPSAATGAAPTDIIPAFALKDVKPVNGGLGTVNSMASTGGVFTPQVKAFLDSVVKRESNGATTNIAQSYYSVNLGTGYFSQATANQSRSQITGFGNYIGRYQMGTLGETEAKARFGIPSMKFNPMDQDIMAYNKLVYRGALKPLYAGDVKSALLRVANEWVSIPNPNAQNQQIQPGTTFQEYVDYYYQRLKFYQSQEGIATTATQVSPKKPVAPVEPSVTNTQMPVIKGSLIRINIGSFDFSFYHQGTEMSENGQTILTGQGIRWVMSRRVRSSTHKDITLKQLATKVAKDHKLTLDYQASIDPQYSHIDQSGISDYALLLREVEQSGLMVTEDKTKIVIKERAQLGQPKMVLSRGDNLISYKINDKALTGNEEAISADLPQVNKSIIDPITGKQVSTKVDKDRVAVKSGTITGKPKPATNGSIKGDKSLSDNSKARTKRIGGLPSIFVIPLTAASLTLTPLCTVSTAFMTPVLNRVWVVKTVQHDVAANTTTLSVVSPVEVVDSNPAVVIPAQIKAGVNTVVDAGRGWVYPTTGTVTSLWNPSRRNPVSGIVRPHRGVDIGAASGTPIYAADAGIVVKNYFNSGGGGNVLNILHDNGYTSQYLHMRVPGFPAVGARVRRGEPIGEVGNTGIGTGAHLHFELFRVDSATRENPGAIYSKYRAVGMTSVALKPCD